jgi:hypothetical protein
VGQERLGPSYFFISLVLGPLNSLVCYVPSLSYTRGLGWRIHCDVEVTESSTNKQHINPLLPETQNLGYVDDRGYRVTTHACSTDLQPSTMALTNNGTSSQKCFRLVAPSCETLKDLFCF